MDVRNELSKVISKIYNFIKVYGQNFDITLIIHILIYFLVQFVYPTVNIFVNMLAIDGTISAVQFIKTIHESGDDIDNRDTMNKIKETDLLIRKSKDFISKKYPKYITSFDFNNEGYVNNIKKVFFYVMAQIVSTIFGIVFWGYGQSIINALLLIFGLPILYITVISSSFFLQIFKLITQGIRSISVFILSKITAKIINNLAETCIGSSPKIDYCEMIEFYEDFENSIESGLLFLKTVMIQTLVYYGKKTDNTLYYYLLSLFHKYQIEAFTFQASGMTNEMKSKILYETVKTRKWNDFLKPKTVNIIFEIYESKSNDQYSRRIGLLLRNIKITFKRLMAMWSLSNISPLLAIIVDSYFTFMDRRFDISHTYLPYAIGACILYMNNYLLGGVLVILSEIIIKPLLDYIDEKELISKYIIISKDQAKYIILIPSIWFMPYVALLYAPIIQYINGCTMLNVMIEIVSIMAILSGNNLFHITFLIMSSLVIYNIIHYKEPEIKPVINISLIDNYLGQSIENINKMKMLSSDVKIIKIKEEVTYQDKERRNVCKWISSLVY
jgi:hypothetical protein